MLVNVLIIGLSLALIPAVGWVAYGMGRIAVSVFRDVRAARRPLRQWRHPEFGILTHDTNLWSGQVRRGGRDIGFTIAGTETEPDRGLFERLQDATARLPALERMALEFLCAESPEVRQGEFAFYSLDFLWEQRPDCFAMEFTLAGDDDGIWRVEFEAGRPKFIGRDD